MEGRARRTSIHRLPGRSSFICHGFAQPAGSGCIRDVSAFLLVDLDPRQAVEVVGKPAGAGSAATLPAKQNLGRVFLGNVIGDRSGHHLNHRAERFFLRVIFLRVQLAELEGLGRGTSLFLLFQHGTRTKEAIQAVRLVNLLSRLARKS